MGLFDTLLHLAAGPLAAGGSMVLNVLHGANPMSLKPKDLGMDTLEGGAITGAILGGQALFASGSAPVAANPMTAMTQGTSRIAAAFGVPGAPLPASAAAATGTTAATGGQSFGSMLESDLSRGIVAKALNPGAGQQMPQYEPPQFQRRPSPIYTAMRM